MRPRIRPFTVAIASGIASVALCIATPSTGWADGGNNDSQGDPGSLSVKTILSGASLTHSFVPAGASTAQTERLSHPDDIARLGDKIFVGFQNGVGAQGEPSNSSGNLDSTVVELTTSGHPVAQWDITGKDDGLTADPALHAVIATVNEDGGSSLYTITPGGGGTVQQYAYNQPLPHFGGTDAISIVGGQILISASAPGATGGSPAPQATYPAVYSVTLDPSTSVATVTPVFFDEDPAVVANLGSQYGQTINLALTDPDSSEVVPFDAPRFGGDFMLDSQGDQQQIFLHGHTGSAPTLSVLNLSQAVDDTAWPESDGTLFATDSTNDVVDAVTGGFPDRPVVAVTPCGSNSAPSTCPAPPLFPANYLGTVNPWTGQVDPLTTTGVAIVPQGGLLFVPSDQNGEGSQGNQGGDQG
jgi:hypothetical protein